MILVGNRRGGAADLARHLMNVAENDHVHIHETRGFIAGDLHGAFHEAYAVAKGTRCKKFLYSLSLSPPQTEDVPDHVFEAAIEEIEQKLGFTNQPRAIVFHEKKGRRHAHCVWSRIDAATMRAIDPYQDKLKLESIARGIFLTHGWQMPPGFKRRTDTDPLNYTHAQSQQAGRAGRDPKEIKRIFAACWQRSDSKAALALALKEHGFILAQGDRRGFVAVDREGEVYALARWAGVKTREVRARLGEYDDLPSVDQARQRFEPESSLSDGQSLATAKQGAALEEKRQAMVAAQRQERVALENRHQQRRIAETQVRQARIPAGLRGAWAKLTGTYQATLEEIEAEAQRCETAMRAEYHALIRRQLAEIRAVQDEIACLQEQGNDPAPRLLRTDPAQVLVTPPDPEAETLAARVRRDPAQILDVITDKKENFTRPDIVRALAEHIDEPLRLTDSVECVMRSAELVEIKTKPVPRYSTLEMVAEKLALTNRVAALSVQCGASADKRHSDAAIRAQNKSLKASVSGSLSREQEAAIRHCMGPERLAAVVGLAGAGKSTMLTAVRDAYERQGYCVRGAALSGKAVDGLESASGIKSRTLASLERSWKQGYDELTGNDVLVIDETGMIGTRQLNRFMAHVEKTGAKLILVGDPEQLQPINAGTPFREITQQIDAAKLTEIHRQKDGWQKQASLDLAQRRTESALDAYELHGRIKCKPDTSEAILTLVEDYMTDLAQNGSTISRLALAHRRKDVHAINQAIRAARQAASELTDDVMIRTDHGKRAFAPGDRLLFTRNDHDLGVRNGMLGTVQSVHETKLTVRLDGSDGQAGRVVTLNPKLYSAFDHGYATTIHKSQGATVDNAYILASPRMDRHLTYVALTRHRQSATLYGDRNTLQKLKHAGIEVGPAHSRQHRRRQGPTMQ